MKEVKICMEVRLPNDYNESEVDEKIADAIFDYLGGEVVDLKEFNSSPSAEELARLLTDFVNKCPHDEEGFIEEILNSHRTLQQSTFRLFAKLVKEWAKMYSEGRYDPRNEATCSLSKRIIDEILSEEYVPFI